METFRIAFDHLFILAIALFLYAVLAGIMSARKEPEAPYGSLFLGLMAYGAWFQALYSSAADRFSVWDLALLGGPIVLSIFLLPLAAVRLFALKTRSGFHWVALILTLAYLPFFAMMAHQAIAGIAFTR
jgi:hypothetical protein